MSHWRQLGCVLLLILGIAAALWLGIPRHSTALTPESTPLVSSKPPTTLAAAPLSVSTAKLPNSVEVLHGLPSGPPQPDTEALPRTTLPPVGSAQSATPIRQLQQEGPFWLRGRVVRPDQQPVSEFQVEMVPPDDAGASQVLSCSFQASTGEFELSWDQQGPADLRVESQGYMAGVVPSVTLAQSREEAERWEIVLVPGGQISGRVVNTTGQPVSSALVELGQYLYYEVTEEEEVVWNDQPDASPEEPAALGEITSSEPWNPNPSQRTDGDGYFVLTELPQGTYQLSVTHPDYFSTSQEVTIMPGSDQLIEVMLSNETGSLIITVVDAQGHPLIGRNLALAGEQQVVGTSDAQGRWQAKNLRPGRYDVTLLSEQEQPGEGHEVVHRARAQVAGGQETQLLFQIPRGVDVLGLVDLNDEPVSGALVHLSRVRGADDVESTLADHYASVSVSTDAHGRFAVSQLPPGHYEVLVTSGEEASRMAVTLMASDQARTLQLHLGSTSIEGVVKDGLTGKPIPNVEVRSQLLQSLDDLKLEDDTLFGNAQGVAMTDANGRYRLKELSRGYHLLEYEVPAPYGSGRAQIQISQIITRHNIDVFPSGELVVTVLGQDSVPIKGAAVVLVSESDPNTELVTPTDELGMMHLPRLAMGTYHVEITDARTGASTRTVTDIRSGEVSRLSITLNPAS